MKKIMSMVVLVVGFAAGADAGCVDYVLRLLGRIGVGGVAASEARREAIRAVETSAVRREEGALRAALARRNPGPVEAPPPAPGRVGPGLVLAAGTVAVLADAERRVVGPVGRGLENIAEKNPESLVDRMGRTVDGILLPLRIFFCVVLGACAWVLVPRILRRSRRLPEARRRTPTCHPSAS